MGFVSWLRPDYVLAVLGFTWATLAFNVYRPIRPTVSIGTLTFFAGWLFGELAAHHAVAQLAIMGLLVWDGALDHTAGWVGACLTIASAAMLMRYHELGHGTGVDSMREVRAAGVDTSAHEARVGVRALLSPFAMQVPGVRVARHEEIVTLDGHALHADVFHREDVPPDAPVLVYVHGGGWTIGYKQYQGLPIVNALAKAGWVCISISYRLSPKATFPDHIHDVLRGIDWAKKNAQRWGGRTNAVSIAGNSAGAHLAALAALGHDRAALRPADLADADLSVEACVGLYGVYDFTNRHGHWPGAGIVPFVERIVLKKSLATDPDAFRDASPLDWVRADAPPFFLIHGSNDTLAPVEESRCLAVALREVSSAPVIYAEVAGAQHAFEIFHSVRGRYAVRAIVAFLESQAPRRDARSSRAQVEVLNA